VSELVTFLTALVISMVVIPAMIKVAPRLGMVDLPDSRKVHSHPVPRVGGIGIVVGSLVPIIMWLPLDTTIRAYLFGAAVLLGFGAWDDSRELGHYTKFIGQFVAVLAVVYYGDLHVKVFPFIYSDGVPPSIGKPFTVFAMVGMINAINHSDGLDGLAGGLSILSLACIAYLASLADGTMVVHVAIAALGGVFGFLRYNSHPAQVFMGDSGSQFLGYTLAFLAVALTQNVNPALSPALPLLFLGLPIIDILAVFAQRIYHGMNWFRATKNHIHHRLLGLNFDHYEAVVIIYSVQAFFVVSAILLRYESDAFISSIYLGTCGLLFGFLLFAQRYGWRAHRSNTVSVATRIVQYIYRHKILANGPLYLVGALVPLFFVVVSVGTQDVPIDFAVLSASIGGILLAFLLLGGRSDSLTARAGIYLTAATMVYLASEYSDRFADFLEMIETPLFVIAAIAIALAVRFSNEVRFRTTPMDYLLIVIVISVGFLSRYAVAHQDLAAMLTKLVVMFYGCELLITRMRQRWNPLVVATLISLAVLGLRGLA